VNKLCTGRISNHLHLKQSGEMSLQKLSRLPAVQRKWLT